MAWLGGPARRPGSAVWLGNPTWWPGSVAWLSGLARQLADRKNMSMSGPVYMHASIATPGLAANHHLGNGLDHLRFMERPEAHIIFSSTCSSQYTLWCVIQHVNYSQVQYTTRLQQYIAWHHFVTILYQAKLVLKVYCVTYIQKESAYIFRNYWSQRFYIWVNFSKMDIFFLY